MSKDSYLYTVIFNDGFFSLNGINHIVLNIRILILKRQNCVAHAFIRRRGKKRGLHMSTMCSAKNLLEKAVQKVNDENDDDGGDQLNLSQCMCKVYNFWLYWIHIHANSSERMGGTRVYRRRNNFQRHPMTLGDCKKLFTQMRTASNKRYFFRTHMPELVEVKADCEIVPLHKRTANYCIVFAYIYHH